MPQSFCVICRRRIARGSRCSKHIVRSPSNRAWHEPGAARTRRKVLQRDSGCVICGATEDLEVHHRTPAALGGATEVDNLVVFCRDHHLELEAEKVDGLGLRPMEVVIAFRPETERGRDILDQLERETDLQPDHVAEDGTRRYHIAAPDVDIDYFDSKLDRIAWEWRSHVTTWRADGG
jgi:5-methylcytosine-specific restriction endonuclease McrA